MKYANHGNFTKKLRLILLGAGTTGVAQHILNQKTRTKIFQRDQMVEILDEWQIRGWVQKFVVVGLSKHPKVVWRATTKLRDEWSSLQISGELPVGPAPEVAIDQEGLDSLNDA